MLISPKPLNLATTDTPYFMIPIKSFKYITATEISSIKCKLFIPAWTTIITGKINFNVISTLASVFE